MHTCMPCESAVQGNVPGKHEKTACMAGWRRSRTNVWVRVDPYLLSVYVYMIGSVTSLKPCTRHIVDKNQIVHTVPMKRSTSWM